MKGMEAVQKIARRSVVVVVPTLNEERALADILETLIQQRADHDKFDIVVADGGSSDRTREIANQYVDRYSFMHLIHNPRRLQGAAVNLVARRWQHKVEYLVRCDAHADYPPSFVPRLLDTIERTGADSVVVPMDTVGEHCIDKAVAWISDTRVGSGGSAHRGGRKSGYVDHGHHAAFKLERFIENGGYDEGFSHNEDAEFDCRLSLIGGKIFLDADIRIQYHPRNSFFGLWKQYFNYGKGRSRTVKRHPSSLRLRQLAVPAFMWLMLCSMVIAPFSNSVFLWIVPFLYASVLGVCSFAIAARERAFCGLLCGVAALTMHAAWAAGFTWGYVTVRERPWKDVILSRVPNAPPP